MDVNNANTLSLMRHRIKLHNVSIGHVFWRLFPSGLTNSKPVLWSETHVCAEK